MALLNLHLRIILHRTQHLNIGVMLNGFAQLGGMTRPTHAVKDNSGNIHFPIKRLIPQQKRGYATGHTPRIHHQNNGRTGKFSNGSIAVSTIQRHTIVQAFIRFDQRNVSIQRIMLHRLDNLIRCHGIKIKVVAGALAGSTKPQRINVIRAFLERLYPQALMMQSSAQTNRKRGLARGFVGRGNEDSCHADILTQLQYIIKY